MFIKYNVYIYISPFSLFIDQTAEHLNPLWNINNQINPQNGFGPNYAFGLKFGQGSI